MRDGIIPARAGFTAARSASRKGAPDHPRSRGVYGGYGWVPRHEEGSSPLARGLRAVLDVGEQGPRIIPARAGFTSTRASSSASTTDHPRSRGVYLLQSMRVMSPWGSSPLARGLQRGCKCISPVRRIIPARAGFTP